jgi:hypothetical protein
VCVCVCPALPSEREIERERERERIKGLSLTVHDHKEVTRVVHRKICCEQSTLWRLPASVPVHAHRTVLPMVARVVQESAVGSTLGQLMQKSGWILFVSKSRNS